MLPIYVYPGTSMAFSALKNRKVSSFATYRCAMAMPASSGEPFLP
jgi:hypothetical protein